MTREVLGDANYRQLIRALGITTSDNDILIDGEKIGTKTHAERDFGNYLAEEADWASYAGKIVHWGGVTWDPAEDPQLRAKVFETMSKATIIAAGEEVPYTAKNSTASAVQAVFVGRLLNKPLPEPNPLELPLTNGVLNIETREIVPHRKELWHQWTVDIEYDPSAQCPRWEQFVRESVQEAGVAPFLQEWAGYCLMSGNLWQRMLWLYGPSGTGKSTFLKVLDQLLGPASTAISSEKFSEYDIASLAGKRVAMASELSPKTLKTSVLKALIAGDPIQARHPYGRPFAMSFQGKLVWSSNGMPPLDQAEGMRRRVNVVEFSRVPPIADVYLDERLKSELPGILNWALEGAGRLISLRREGSSGWRLPESVQAFVDEYMDVADPLAMFFEEDVELDVLAEVPVIEVYQRYVEWAKVRQVRIEQLGPAFFRGMRAYGLEPVDPEDQVSKRKNVRFWRGGKLIPGTFNFSRD